MGIKIAINGFGRIGRHVFKALSKRPEFEVVVLDKRLPEPELLPVVKDVVAMVVRSETKVTVGNPEELKVQLVALAQTGDYPLTVVAYTDGRTEMSGYRVATLRVKIKTRK